MVRVNWFVVSCVLAVVAVVACSTSVVIDTRPNDDAGVAQDDADVGDGSSDVDASLSLLPDGAPCDVNTQCVNDYCVPSKTNLGNGVCFSASTNGCVAITLSSPFVSMCDVTTNYLITCGDTYDTSTFTDCVIVGMGPINEYYWCCPK